MGTTIVECNPVAIDLEPFGGAAPSARDEGGNACGCDGRVGVCAAQTTSLEPMVPADAGAKL